MPVVDGPLGGLDEASVLDRKTLGTVDATGDLCIRRGSEWGGCPVKLAETVRCDERVVGAWPPYRIESQRERCRRRESGCSLQTERLIEH